MEPKHRELILGFAGTVIVLFVALLLVMGCTPSAVSKPQEQIQPKGQGQAGTKVPEVATGKQAKLTPSSRPPTSSLEAHQKGTLGKGFEISVLKEVNFDFDRYDLRADARAILKTNADWLKANPSVRAQVEGHADERGTNEYNLALGAKRAESVRRYLIDVGISTSRLSTTSYGEELPICKEHNEECWAKNRRAHFAIKTAPTN